MTITISDARIEFLNAQQAFRSAVEKSPVPETRESVFTPLSRALRSVLGSISWDDAAKGYVASHDALSKLADATTDVNELRRYTNCMIAVTAEYTAVVDKIFASTSGSYQKVTDALKAAAGDLKAALKKAKDTADKLNLLAQVVGAFSKLIPVL